MGAIGYRKTSHAHTGVSERDAGYKGQHVQPGALLYLLLQRKKKKKKREEGEEQKLVDQIFAMSSVK